MTLLRRTAEDVGATAHLTITDGGGALAVAVIEPSWTDYHVAYRVGSRHPLGRGAAGLALLALDSPAEPGYVATSGELQPGAHGIAAPVMGVSNLRASVGVIPSGNSRWMRSGLDGTGCRGTPRRPGLTHRSRPPRRGSPA